MEAERDWKMSGFGDQQKAEVSFTSISVRSSAVPPNIPVSQLEITPVAPPTLKDSVILGFGGENPFAQCHRAFLILKRWRGPTAITWICAAKGTWLRTLTAESLPSFLVCF